MFVNELTYAYIVTKNLKFYLLLLYLVINCLKWYICKIVEISINHTFNFLPAFYQLFNNRIVFVLWITTFRSCVITKILQCLAMLCDDLFHKIILILLIFWSLLYKDTQYLYRLKLNKNVVSNLQTGDVLNDYFK